MADRASGLDPYVPRVASDWDVHAPNSLWRAVDGTLVFVDISGFTNLSERLSRKGRIGAEELTVVLNKVFGDMLEIVFERGGSLLKFGGDALLLLFDYDNHVMQAVAATVEMRAALRQASKERTSVGRIDLKMSSGIHTGEIDLFLVGESHRELIVTGPVASHTTEMESTAEAGEIVVSRAVAEQLPDGYATETKGRGLLLRKQKIDCPRCGPVHRETDHSPDLASFVPARLRDHLTLGLSDSEHRIATIGFIKFKGVDAMLADNGPEAVGPALDELIRQVQGAVDKEEITFLATDIDADGGKVIIAGGVPASQHDDEGRVLRAARSIADSDLDLSVQIGVNRGHVFAGDVGTTFRRTFTVMGDTVNLAARLMAAAPPGSLYASPGVLDEASTLFRTEALEPFHVKGKEQLVLAYEVLEEIGVRPPETKHELPFHGREAELEMLVSIVTTCARVGRGGMMTIAGDTGIGKSRLIAEVIERCPGLATLTIKAEPNGSDNPYWAFRDPMRRELGIERGDSKAMTRQLSATLRRTASDLLPLLPLLGDVFHISIADNETTSAIDPQFRPDRTADAIVELLSALHREPFAVVAEDAQWLDEASRNLLLRIGSAAETRPWTVIATVRDTEELNVDTFGDGIALAPLDDETIRQITIEATAAAPLRPHELDNIVNRAGGNPLFLSEIIGVIRDTGNAEDIPDSLDAVVSTQIDALPPLARQTLRYASVLGNSFPTLVLEEFLAPDEIELDKATRTTLEHFIESDGSQRLRFKHAVVHDVAYRGLPYRRRKELHGRAGEIVEKISGDPNASAEFLAFHFYEAGRYEQAWLYARIAADKARSAFANAEAASHYERALDSARHLPDIQVQVLADTWTGLGEMRDLTGDFERARVAFNKALQVATASPVKVADLQLRRAKAWMGSGDLMQAKRSIGIGRRVLANDSNQGTLATLAKLVAYEARIHAAEENPTKASKSARQAIRLGNESGAEEAIANAYEVLDWANFMLGEAEPRHGREAIRIFQDLGMRARASTVMNNMGALAYIEGDWNGAVDWYVESLEGAELSGDVFAVALTRVNLAEILISQRRYAEAEKALAEGERVHLASRTHNYIPLIELLKARLAIGRDNPEVASTILRASLSMNRGSAWDAETRVTLAEALARSGEPDDAFEALDTMRRDHPSEAEDWALRSELVKGLAYEQLADHETSIRILETALTEAVSADSTFEAVLIAEGLIRTHSQAGSNVPVSVLQRLDTDRSRLGIETPAHSSISS